MEAKFPSLPNPPDLSDVFLKFPRGSERIFERPKEDTVRAFWRPGPVFMSDEHESGNTGTRPLEWIAITFKKESISTDNPPEQFVGSGEE